jgi:hypothetical protein
MTGGADHERIISIRSHHDPFRPVFIRRCVLDHENPGGGEVKITADMIIEWDPCESYTPEMIRDGIGGGKTPLEICDLDIPAQDKLWLLLREEIIPAKDLHEFACQFAETALHAERAAGREPHPDSWKAIEVKRRWMAGVATDEDLSAASATAWDAAWATAWDAAWATAWDAARDAAWAAARAARDAAWAAASAAAWGAASAAAWGAARAASDAASYAAWAEQLEKVREYLEVVK